MLETYNIYYFDYKVGKLIYDTKNDRFEAYLHDDSKGYPARLFTIKPHYVVHDAIIKRWIRHSVAPKTRENIRDILKYMGLPRYDAWGIFKFNHDHNANDYATIKLDHTEEGELEYIVDEWYKAR